MKKFSVLLIAFCLHGAIGNVSVTGVTNTQAVLRYTAPDLNACTVEASESQTYSPLVNDVNATLFPGSNSDERAEASRSALERVFVVGKRAVERAADGKRYSRALKAHTLHYFRITCGADSATGIFVTANIAWGNTATDSFTAIDEAGLEGYYNFSTFDYADRHQSFIDPLTGAAIHKLTSGKDSGGQFSNRAPAACSGTNWSLTGCSGSYNAGSRDPLFAEHSTGYPNGFLAKVNVYLKASISGSPTGDDKYLDVCLTLDGTTCASPGKAVDLTTCSTSAYQGNCNGFGSSTSPGIFFDTWGTEFPLVGWGDVNANKPTGFLFKPRTSSALYTINIDEIRYSGTIFFELTPYSSATDMQCGLQEITDNADGSTYYLCFARGANQFVSFDATKGRSYWLGPNMVAGSTNRSDIIFSPSDGREFYVLDSASVRVVRGRITGDLKSEHTGSGEQANPAFIWTTLTPSSYHLKYLLNAFDAAFDSEWQTLVGGCALRGMVKQKLVFQCIPQQDLGGALGVFDPAASPPPGSSGQGNVVAAMFVGKTGLLKYGILHSVSMTVNPDTSPWIGIGTSRSSTSSSQFWGGPWVVKVQKPGGADLAPADTQFEVLMNNGSYEPTDPQPGGAGDATIPAEPGDLFLYNGDGSGTIQPSSGDEVLELVSKDDVNHIWTMRRAGSLNTAKMLAGSGFTASGTPYTRPLTIPGGSLLYAIPKYYPLSNSNYFISPVLWNSEADPHGNMLVFPATNGTGTYPPASGSYDESSGYASPQVLWHYYIGSHGAGQLKGVISDAGGLAGCSGRFGSQGLCYFVGEGNIPNVVNTPPAHRILRDASFAAQVPTNTSSAYESHANRSQYRAGDRGKLLAYDVQPFANGHPAFGANAPVAGTFDVYKVTGSNLHRKHFATFATCGDRILRDISSPGSVISDSTPYTYCVAHAAGECRGDSAAGDIYVNCPGRTESVCHAGVYSTNQLYDAWLPWKDICVGDRAPTTMGVLQIDATGTSHLAENLRILAFPFPRYQAQSVFQNAYALPRGDWLVTATARHERPDYLLVRVPPIGAKGADPGTFRRMKVTVSSVPQGADNIVIDFGYAENGPADGYYCTTRREACSVASPTVNESNPFLFASEVSGGIPCASGCAAEVPALPGRVVHWRIRYRNSANQTIRFDAQAPVAN